GFLINWLTVSTDPYLRAVGCSVVVALAWSDRAHLYWYIADLGWYIVPTALEKQAKMAINRCIKDQY
ncbi:hypothetical protein, partial [Pseudomonas syringae]|uniref:hypothetical protein n=1 Tax=Pseudomonas syringae TaxID=317 RepID=UPI001F1CE9BA